MVFFIFQGREDQLCCFAGFSTLKLVKTNLKNRLKETMLDWRMWIAIEGPDALSEEDITLQFGKRKKPDLLYNM